MRIQLLPAFVLLFAAAALADSARQSDDGVITIEFDKPAGKVTTTYAATRWGMYDVSAILVGGDKPAGGGFTVQIGERKSTVENDRTRIYIAKDGKNTVVAEAAGGAEIRGLILTPTTEGKPVVQSDDHSITLHCRDAIVHGTTLRYEYQPIKTALGYWAREKDWASWDFEVKHPAKFNVFVMHGSNGGSEIEIKVAGQTLNFTAKNTGSFHTFTFLEVGSVTLDKAGPASLTFKPTKKVGGAIMDLRAVILLPVMK